MPLDSSNFIPEVWAGELYVGFQMATVAKSFFNSRYEGEIQAFGDTVHIVTPGSVNVAAYSGSVSFASPSDTEQSLAIDQAKYWSFQVNDIKAAQEKYDSMGAYTAQAAQQLAEAVDTDLFAVLVAGAASANVIDAGTVDTGTLAVNRAVELSYTNIYGYLTDASKALSWLKVPQQGRVIALSPDEIALLNKANLFYGQAENVDLIRNGFKGRIAGFDVYESANLPVETETTVRALYRKAIASWSVTTNVVTIVTAAAHGLTSGDDVYIYGMTETALNSLTTTREITVTNTTTFTFALTKANASSTADTTGFVLLSGIPYFRYLPFAHISCSTVADQITVDEPLRLESTFATGIRGLLVYGRKVVDANGVGYIAAKIGTVAPPTS